MKDFKEFIGQGSAIDLAVGVIIGSAMTAILTSFVNELIVPLTGLIGSVDFANLYWTIKGTVPEGLPLEEARKLSGVVVLGYGQFTTVAVNTLLLAFVVFLVVRGINNLRREQAEEPIAEPEAESPPAEEVLLTEIRDLLKKQTEKG